MTLPAPYYDRDGITIYHADCADILPHVDPATVGLVLTDPPYGIDHDPSSTIWSTDHRIAEDDTAWNPAPVLAFGRCILWGADNFAARLPASRGWIVWEKRGGMDSTGNGLQVPDAELAWTNVAGRHRVFSQLWAGPLRSEVFYHPTQKSVGLMRWILDQWSQPGDLVLDPYMGSGPVAQACHELGRRYIGVELVEAYCETAVKRLGQLVLPL